jgi:serine/threonine protein kinase
VHDAGTVDGRVYIAMEFVDGETVDAWLRAGSRGWREVVDVFIAAGRGLAAAHAAGIVHRDFKPQNVMIGRDGTVRVMDFGLARLADEPLDVPYVAADSDRARVAATVTKTGALVGTVAYMAPEQFRGEAIDARADQFSFCVALHEALFGSRPALAHMAAGEGSKGALSRTVPSWLRAVVSHGLAENRGQRFGAMDDLIRALAKGRARPRRRLVALSLSLVIMIVALGGWRVARGGHIQCTIPTSRLDAIWSGHHDSRRDSIHHAFATSGRPTADTSWQRVSKALDDYVSAWSAMYLETCEATHVRGEQSGDVLDVRMSCLNDNLDQVRAVTNVLMTADSKSIGHAVTAVQGITPVSRCADVALLRSAVPLPRDELTLRKVQGLQRSLKEVQALIDLGDFAAAHERAAALRPEAEAVGYRPLIAQVLGAIGDSEILNMDAAHAEVILRAAVFTAEACRDDATAARAAANLIYVVGYRSGRRADAELWMQWAEAILDRIGPGTERTRSWVKNNYGAILDRMGDFARAVSFVEEAVALKEKALGKEHPDVALSLANLAYMQNELGRPAEALPTARRALGILVSSGDPDSEQFANAYNSLGEALILLGRFADAERPFAESARITRRVLGARHFETAYPLFGLGEAKLGAGDPSRAVPLLEEALSIREESETDPVKVAETRFALARALWESGGNRHRAIALATSADTVFTTQGRVEKARSVKAWLTGRMARR